MEINSKVIKECTLTFTGEDRETVSNWIEQLERMPLDDYSLRNWLGEVRKAITTVQD